MRKLVFLLACCVASPALAQQQPAPEVEAMSARLMQEINASLSCSTGMVSARREIERLQAKIKDFEPSTTDTPKK